MRTAIKWNDHIPAKAFLNFLVMRCDFMLILRAFDSEATPEVAEDVFEGRRRPFSWPLDWAAVTSQGAGVGGQEELGELTRLTSVGVAVAMGVGTVASETKQITGSYICHSRFTLPYQISLYAEI